MPRENSYKVLPRESKATYTKVILLNKISEVVTLKFMYLS